ncbi:hydrogen gas-evolving membrane-bound hydrogenase subunit E [Oharaeibacter diazotrophicus]|uniref:Multisubunit sodium/proton antiporter MrpA subunit n=1 Tax=Oharaeibacter diazotrophicus TaxID=1920512 RepID=A0A4R6RB55_9HYPH|nr:hydrogen gas-evolving membrane-bound hydrogenase subunit E [Oharaeibacter diazotrophicus]TDP83244.1 multisubunit sodium/proton antiporter MrpA subunit [Oharaeibacter diazotrophicus]BBE72077.1 Na(+)/H(+) antiporter subunit A [Pleomorphomonas sp. SM30]GLS78842.1 Na(+)/H(+) antiporter subunit A [Oharaeibacter diazotrophicus]
MTDVDVGAPVLLLLAAPFLGAALARPAVAAGNPGVLALAAIPAALFAYFASLVGVVADGGRLHAGVDWLPGFGVRFSILIDGLSLLFSLLITGIGTLIVVYAGAYMHGHAGAARLIACLMLFMGAMLGLVLADDALTLFVFWEGTSITSFLLIGFDRGRMRARRAALQALVITGAGGLALLAALLLAGGVVGERSLSAIAAGGTAIGASPLATTIFALVALAAFTKSAQVPFHVWLPNAMEAPTPVSAYLHSATMVKAGVYLLMRLHPALGDLAAWTPTLTTAGGLTLVTGAVLALRQHDLKLMLAQTTVASLGLLVLLLGVGTEGAIRGAVAYLLAHALFKGALFMIAGGIDHAAGTRDVRRLGGLAKVMPVTFAAALVAAVSMAGLPPMLGFPTKEVLYAGLVDAAAAGPLVVAVVGNAAMFAIAFAVALTPFRGPAVPLPSDHPHENGAGLLAGPVVLGLAGLAAALLAHDTGAQLLAPAATAIAGRPLDVALHLVPEHLDPALGLSALTIALGVGAYLTLARLRAAVDAAVTGVGWGPDAGFDQLVGGATRLAHAVLGAVQSGRLETYMTTVVAALAVALLAPMIAYGELPAWPAFAMPRLHEAAILAIALVGLAAVLRAPNRLTAIVSLGIQGFSVAVLFMLYGAPDLSFTQFMVETLSVVILALVMTRLSLGERDPRPPAQMLLDGGFAVLVGTGFALLLMSATQVPFDRRLTDFYEAASRTVAHGRNIVNVIIVDFRGLDTLGEIAVVMITGLAILALVRVKARAPIVPDPEKRP